MACIGKDRGARRGATILLTCACAGLIGTAVAMGQSAKPADSESYAAQAAAEQQKHDQATAGLSVAERLVAIAHENLVGAVDENALRQSVALIEAASRLAPTESRYLRMLANARYQLKDVPGEIKAWEDYRKLEPDDRVAQVRLIDLFAQRMQTADAREKYLASLLDRQGIADEVKSHVATEAARLLLNRSAKEASVMADRAVKFAPLPEALFLQYQLLPKDASAPARFKALLAILEVDPVQPDALSQAASLLSDAGMYVEAKAFYSTVVECLRRQQVTPPHELLLAYAASLYLAGDQKLAEGWSDSVLASVPNDVDFQFFKLTVLKHGSDAPPDDALSSARDALTAQWSEVNSAILGLPAQGPGDAGQPVVAPDPQEAAHHLAQLQPSKQTQQVKDAFIQSMVDLAWLELYYANKPDDARRWIDALKVVVPADSTAVQRLEGWYSLREQKPKDAAGHFSAVHGKDALTELGLILLARVEATPKTLQTAAELKQQLLNSHYDGLLQTIIHQALAPEIAPPPPAGLPEPHRPAPASQPATQPTTQASSDVQAMTDALKQFPAGVLAFANTPEKFYTLHLTPLTSSVRYGEPIMASLTVQNTGDFSLPISLLGPLLPEVLCGAEPMESNLEPARAIEALSDRLALRPGEGVQNIVRLDQGTLGEYLQATISPGLILLSGEAYTNPVVGKTKDGKTTVEAGAGGLHCSTDQLIARKVPDLLDHNARTQFYQDLQNGPPDVRIDSLDLLASTARYLNRQQKNPDDAKEFITVVDHYSADPVATVADWAKYRSATVTRPDLDKLIQAMMGDKDWLVRFMAVMAMRNEPYPVRRHMTEALAKDGDATVRELADATLARLNAAATQPAPTTEPAAASDSTVGPSTMPGQ